MGVTRAARHGASRKIGGPNSGTQVKDGRGAGTGKVTYLREGGEGWVWGTVMLTGGGPWLPLRGFS